jgi:hypothetical protein
MEVDMEAVRHQPQAAAAESPFAALHAAVVDAHRASMQTAKALWLGNAHGPQLQAAVAMAERLREDVLRLEHWTREAGLNAVVAAAPRSQEKRKRKRAIVGASCATASADEARASMDAGAAAPSRVTERAIGPACERPTGMLNLVMGSPEPITAGAGASKLLEGTAGAGERHAEQMRQPSGMATAVLEVKPPPPIAPSSVAPSIAPQQCVSHRTDADWALLEHEVT